MARPGKKPLATKPVDWKVSIDGNIAAQVELRLLDPIIGLPRYGARAKLINTLLAQWLEEQKKT